MLSTFFRAVDHVRRYGVRLVLDKELPQNPLLDWLRKGKQLAHKATQGKIIKIFGENILIIDFMALAIFSTCQIFHQFGELLYERNIEEAEGWQVGF